MPRNGPDGSPAVRRFGRAVQISQYDVGHRKLFFRLVHGAARLFQGQANRFGRRLFYAQVAVGDGVLAGNEGMLGVGKALGQILADALAGAVRSVRMMMPRFL